MLPILAEGAFNVMVCAYSWTMFLTYHKLVVDVSRCNIIENQVKDLDIVQLPTRIQRINACT